MMRTALAALCAALMLAAPARAGGFSQDLFDTWLDMRTGGGATDVYWYSEGLLKSFPSGETIAEMVGFDTSTLIRDPDDPTKATQLSRKIFYWFDPETGERLDREPISYEYQVKTYQLDGDEIIYAVESRAGERVSHVAPQKNYSVKSVDGMLWFNYAVFIQRGPGKFENSDFYILPGDDLTDRERYQHSWVSYGVGPIMSNAVAWRYTSFEDMPERITKLVRAEAPLWLEPPRSMDEIKELRDQVQTASAR
jgi:hypothetical protein